MLRKIGMQRYWFAITLVEYGVMFFDSIATRCRNAQAIVMKAHRLHSAVLPIWLIVIIRYLGILFGTFSKRGTNLKFWLMFKNYLKIAFRSLIRNKAFSVINITGLAIGMAGAVIILLWIQNELSYDQFHVNKDRIYEAWNRVSFDGKVMTWNATPKVLARTVERDLPEVEQATRVNWPNRWVFSVGDREQFLEGVQVDPNFLKVFSFPLLEGNPESALNNMNSIVLTEKAAVKLFGKEEAVGKTVRILNQGNFTVSGVLKNLPNNTSLDFEYLMQWRKANDDAEWGNNNTHTFVLLKRNASVAAVQAQIDRKSTR